jgi:glutamine amidotransferase
MQVLFERSTEHSGDTFFEGLNEWPGTVDKLNAPILPHMGWNNVAAAAGSQMFNGITDERFYFVHSYAARNWELDLHEMLAAPKVSWANHGDDFVAAVENGPLWATQFHPEKSGEAGLTLLANWIAAIK